MKKLLLNLILLLLGVTSGFSQQQEFVFQQWAGSSGTQNFFYKNITKSDASGNIYTAGATLNGSGNYDLLLVKYNKSGVVQWTKQYNGSGNGHDMATGIHIDGSGNVYVTGTTYVNGTNYNDILTIKYNSSGTQQWLSTYNGSGCSYDAGGAIVVNAAGNTVFICGGAMTTSNLSDFITVSYNASTGAQNWASTYNYNGNYDVAAKIALTGLNQTTVVVSGGVQHNSTTWKYATVNYASSTGMTLGSPSVSGNNTGSLAELGDICEDATQTYTYVAGSVNNTGTGTGFDYKIAKLQNSNLTVVWERTWNGADSLDDKAADIVVDASGNVYVTGFTTTDTQGKNYATVKYNSSGTLQWTKYHNGAGNGIDEATAINLDASNNVYVTGTSHTGGSQDYYTIKYKPDNTIVWEQAYNGLYNGLDKAYDIAVNPSTNEIAVSGQTQTSTGYSYTTVSMGQATTVINPNEVFNSSFSFTENLAQLLKSNGTSASNIKYYNFSSSPSTYFSDTAVSYVLSSIDTLTATNDTLHRVDRTYSGHKTPGQYGINKRSDYFNFYLAHIPEGRARVTNYNRLITPELYNKIDVLYTGNGKGLVTTFVCKPTSTPAASIKMKFAGADSIRVVNNDLIIYTKLGQIKHPRATAYELDNNGTSYVLGWFPTYVRSGNEITFTLGTYNTSRNLIIDMGMGSGTPTGVDNGNLDWSTYIGGSGADAGLAVTTDTEGSSYVTGYTQSPDFPVAFGPTVASMQFNGLIDAFIGKFTRYAEQKYTVFFGGSSRDEGNDLVITPNGQDLYVTGNTLNSGFPVFPLSNPNNGTYYDSLHGGADAFIIRLKADNGDRLWAQYIGGCGFEEAHAIDIDTIGNVFIGGYTSSDSSCLSNSMFPVYDPGNGAYYQEHNLTSPAGVYNTCFILKFNPANELTWGTYFGGNDHAFIYHLAVNQRNGEVVVTGEAFGVNTTIYSSPCPSPDNGNFPLCDPGSSAYIQSSASSDGTAFIARFGGNNHELQWCSMFGGTGYDVGTGLAISTQNHIYMTGYTSSNVYSYSCDAPVNGGFPLCDAGGFFQDTTTADPNGTRDIFIARFNERDELEWSTYVGGESEEDGSTIELVSAKQSPKVATDVFDNLFVVGTSALFSGIPVDAFPVQYSALWYNQDENAGTPILGSHDAFLLWFDHWNNLEWASMFGGRDTTFGGGHESGMDISVYKDSAIYITGLTSSFSTPYQCPPQLGAEPPFCVESLNATTHAVSDAYLSRFIIQDLTGIEDLITADNNSLLIYPNPSHDIFNVTLKMETSSDVIVELFNNMGQIVYSENIKNVNRNLIYSLSMAGKSNGIYLLSLKTEKRTYSGKIIKQ
jgi:hypothetical protein